MDAVDRVFVGPNTTVRYIHSLDFDRILIGNHALGFDPFIPPGGRPLDSRLVYVDTMGPLHPDFAVLGIPIDVDEAAWFSAVNRSLDAIEKAMAREVVVAAHPRATVGEMESRYGGRTVVYGQTETLLRVAAAVLVSNPSTSIGMAVWHRRPITVLRGPQLFDTHLVQLDVYARLLNLEVLELDQVPQSWQPPSVDLAAYERFLGNYVKRPDTPMLPFWEVVAHDLLNPSVDHESGER